MSNVDFGRYSRRFVQMLWDPEPKNDDIQHLSIWCLGVEYQSKPNPKLVLLQEQVPVTTVDQSTSNNGDGSVILANHKATNDFEHIVSDRSLTAANGDSEEWPEDFLNDFESKIWLTYRSNFYPIPKSDDPKSTSTMSIPVRLKSHLSSRTGFTSDTGWGCMIRSGQSLLANTLMFLRLGREHRRIPQEPEECRIISLFADDPQAPFSVHRFVEHGAAACGTFPGQWFGPSATARCIQALCSSYKDAGLKVYVTGDGPDVFEDVLYDIAKNDDGHFDPTLLLVGTRLGIERVTPAYHDALYASLKMPQAVGIAGGRPSSSHYFIGLQGKCFFYLDPHFTRPALPYHTDPQEYTEQEVDSCHTRRLRRLPIEDMDPSMLIGFLFRTEDDWKTWRRTVKEAPGKHIFHVADAQPRESTHDTERDGALDEVETLDDEHDTSLDDFDVDENCHD